jgi:hypothetical protein
MVTFPRLVGFGPIRRVNLYNFPHVEFFSYDSKFRHETLCFVFFPMELVALNLDLDGFKYDCFTNNTRLIPVLGLVKNPNFHNLYL